MRELSKQSSLPISFSLSKLNIRTFRRCAYMKVLGEKRQNTYIHKDAYAVTTCIFVLDSFSLSMRLDGKRNFTKTYHCESNTSTGGSSTYYDRDLAPNVREIKSLSSGDETFNKLSECSLALGSACSGRPALSLANVVWWLIP